MSSMRIAVIACETFRQELDKVLGDDPDIIYKEYVEFGLHEYPKELRAALIEKVNAWEGRADVVLLGYGTCQSLKDIENELKVPTFKLPADDCIGVLLTPVNTIGRGRFAPGRCSPHRSSPIGGRSTSRRNGSAR